MSIKKNFNRYGQDLQEIVDNNIEVLRYYFDKNRRISLNNFNDYIKQEEPAVRMLSDIRYKPPNSQRKEQQKLIQQRSYLFVFYYF